MAKIQIIASMNRILMKSSKKGDENKMAKKSWLKVIFTLMGLIVVGISNKKFDPIIAQTYQANTINNLAIRALDPVKNDAGLQATSKPLILKKKAAFPDLNTEIDRNLLFSELIIPTPQEGALYEYVNSESEKISPSSAETGFQLIYVKVTENHGQTSILVPIPVSITDTDTTLLLNNRVAVQTSTTDGKIIMYPSDIQNKTTEQLQESVKASAKIKTWDTQTGEDIPLSVASTTINTNSIGLYKAIFEITVESGGEKQQTTFQKDVLVFGANIKTTNYFTVAQNKELTMGTNATTFFSTYQTVSSTTASDATYEWVADQAGNSTEPANKYDSSNPGLKWGFIKMTDKTNPTVSTVIPIPITVTAENQVLILSSKVGLGYSLPVLNVSEIKGKTPNQITEIVTQKLAINAWELMTGEAITADVANSTIDQNSRGTKDITITIRRLEEALTYKLSICIVPDEVFDNDSSEGWEDIPLNSTNGVITNPINGSKMGFPNRGLIDYIWNKTNTGFIIVDKNNQGYTANNDRVVDLPYVNYRKLYQGGNSNITNGLGAYGPEDNFKNKIYLRKGNSLKQIIYDETNQILYVYKLSLKRNLNFSVVLEMYNLSTETKTFGMLEMAKTNYYSDILSFYALGNARGFYSIPQKNYRLTFKFKDYMGNWLSDLRMFATPAYRGMITQNGYNTFGDNMKNIGVTNTEKGKSLNSYWESKMYQLGAPHKQIAQDNSLKVGYEIFVGEDIPYMNILANPEILDVYSDDEVIVDYKLSKIPSTNDHGTVYMTCPNGEEVKQPFVANELKEFNGVFTIPKSKLPDLQSNDEVSPLEYTASLIAVSETDGPMKSLSSQEDYTFKVRMYKFGGEPIAQIVKKDSVWSKTADVLIKDPVVLPGHTPKFEYVNKEKPIDTSKVGFQYTDVRMTDENDPTRTTIIKVPVMIVKGAIPTTGLLLGAYDIATPKSEVADLTDTELNEFILKKSEAVAWDVTTGLSKDVELSVIESSLVNDPEISKTYIAKIQAKKGTLVTTATIEINFGAKLTVNFLDENGNALKAAYTGFEGIGESVDLSEMTEITDILTKLKNDNYELVKKPEESFTMLKDDKSVAYQFNGSLTLLSAPSSLEFETKKATIDAVKFTDPKLIGKPLVVSDTRADKLKWVLKAKIDQPLTSLEDERVKMPNSVKYQYNEDELTLTDENVIIFEHLNTVSGNIDVTKEHWSKGDGFILDLAPGAIKALGKYQAKITITLENAK